MTAPKPAFARPSITDAIGFCLGVVLILALMAWMINNGRRTDAIADCMTSASKAEYVRCANG